MKQFKLRQWRRSYLVRKNRQRATKKVLTTCKMLAIGLMTVAFLLYRLDMTGTHTYFTSRAQLGPVVLQAGEWEVEEEEVDISLVRYKPGDGNAQGGGNKHFNTNSHVTVIIMVSGFKGVDFADLDENEVEIYMEYEDQRAPGTNIWEYRDGILKVSFENKPENKELGKFFAEQVGEGGQHRVEVGLYCRVLNEAPLYIGDFHLDLNIPGHGNQQEELMEGQELLPADKEALEDADPILDGENPAEDEELPLADEAEDGEKPTAEDEAGDEVKADGEDELGDGEGADLQDETGAEGELKIEDEGGDKDEPQEGAETGEEGENDGGEEEARGAKPPSEEVEPGDEGENAPTAGEDDPTGETAADIDAGHGSDAGGGEEELDAGPEAEGADDKGGDNKEEDDKLSEGGKKEEAIPREDEDKDMGESDDHDDAPGPGEKDLSEETNHDGATAS